VTTLLQLQSRSAAGVLADPRPLIDDLDRSAGDADQQVADRVRAHANDLRLEPGDSVLDIWTALAALGREDLTVGRLTEGHVDAVRILHEADRTPTPGAVYGVWASASGGTGLTATKVADGWAVDGVMRYCSGAWFIDRALVVVSTEDGKRLIDIDVRTAQVAGGALTRRDETWPAVGMDATRSVDIGVRGLAIRPSNLVGEPGFYLDRPGFTVGGVGVAAVWLGGAAGILDALVRALAGGSPSAHQQAHLGVMATTIATADTLLAELAQRLDRNGSQTLSAADAGAARAAVELAVEVVLQRAPRVSGPTPLCRDAAFGHRLADLQVYVRQHHAEADYEHLGRHLLNAGELLGRRFG
jgi:alkylation response protein AidB-like acyl-CoA dehydrogenase